MLLKSLAASRSKISITTDCWMSSNAESYITITAHFIDEKWEIRSVVLATRYLDDFHTSENLRDKVHEILNEFHICNADKIFICVHDNARNIVHAM